MTHTTEETAHADMLAVALAALVNAVDGNPELSADTLIDTTKRVAINALAAHEQRRNGLK